MNKVLLLVLILLVAFGLNVFAHETTHVLLNPNIPYSICLGSCVNGSGNPDIAVVSFFGSNVNTSENLPIAIGSIAFISSAFGLIILTGRKHE